MGKLLGSPADDVATGVPKTGAIQQVSDGSILRVGTCFAHTIPQQIESLRKSDARTVCVADLAENPANRVEIFSAVRVQDATGVNAHRQANRGWVID